MTRLVRRRLFFDGAGAIDASLLPTSSYDLAFDFGPTAPTASDECAIVVGRHAEFPAAFAGSYGTAAAGGATSTTVTLYLGSASIGSVGISSGAVVTFTSATPSAAIDLPAGSLVRATMPGTIPSGLLGVRFTLAGEIV